VPEHPSPHPLVDGALGGMTATRDLPTEAGDPRARVVYAPPGPPQRLNSGLLRALGVVGAVFVLLALGAMVGRATVRTGPTTVTTDTPASGAATDTQTQTPPQAAASAAPAVGPSATKDGVPVGYQHSRAGAVAAATNYVAVLASDLVFDTRRRQAAVAALAAPESQAALQRSTEQNAAVLAKALRVPAGGGVGVIARAIPVGAKVDRYDDALATVSIWQTSIGGSTNGAPVQQGWGTTTVNLRWVGGDWKQVSATTVIGPVPLPADALPTAASELIAKTRDFKEYRYAPAP
jgi:hypothetical protein